MNLLFRVSAVALSLAAMGATATGAPEPMGAGKQDEGSAKGAGSPGVYYTNRTAAQFAQDRTDELAQSRYAMDIEIELIDGEERYSAVFMEPPPGVTMHYIIQEDPTAWQNWVDDMALEQGRFLDVEVDYFNGQKKYTGIFYEDGDDYGYAVYTTNTESQFQVQQRNQQEAGRYMVDFEAYETGGVTYYAAIWADDPNQPITSLYYGLESSDVSQLLDPLEGRVIDFERYWSALHNESRYAMIVATYPGSEWGLWRNASASGIADKHAEISDANTHMIEIEFWDIGGSPVYAAVWGDNFGPLHEVAAYPADTEPQSWTQTLTNLVVNFETVNTDVSGDIGFFARNLTTGETVGYREGELFYLASTSKVAMHIRLYQEVQAENVGLDSGLLYTLNQNNLAPWFVDDRGLPGMSSCLCNTNSCGGGRTTDMGNVISVDRIDRGMMQVSDNAATGMLLDNGAWGLSEVASPSLNEWIGSLDGVARGFGPITSIRRLDRLIMWHGQVMDFPTADSFFGAPTHILEQRWRYGSAVTNCTDLNNNGVHDLADFYGGDIPSYSSNSGHSRYYNTSLNQATPKAFVNLLDKFYSGELLDGPNTEAALEVMRVGSPGSPLGTPLDNHPMFPTDTVTRYAKDGAKGGISRPRVNSGIFEYGNQAIALIIASKNHIPAPNPGPNQNGYENINGVYHPNIAYEILKILGTDLQTGGLNAGGDTLNGNFFPDGALPGGTLTVDFLLENLGGSRTPPFDVKFYLSRDTNISGAGLDILIGNTGMTAMDGNTSTTLRSVLTLPRDISPADYYVGWIIDDPGSTLPEWGAVSEYDEMNNAAYLSSKRFTVEDPTPGEPHGDIWVVN